MQLGLYTGIPPVHTTQSYSNANFNSLYSPEPQHSKYHLQAHVPPPIHPDLRRDEHIKCLQAVREATCPTHLNECLQSQRQSTLRGHPYAAEYTRSNSVRRSPAHTSLRPAQSKAYIRRSMISKRRRAYTLE